MDEKIVHKPALEDRGVAKWYYAYAVLDGGEKVFYVMSKSDAQKYGQKYSKSYTSQYSPWQKEFDKMAIKSCVIQLKTWLPKSSDIREAANSDEKVVRIVEDTDFQIDEHPVFVQE